MQTSIYATLALLAFAANSIKCSQIRSAGRGSRAREPPMPTSFYRRYGLAGCPGQFQLANVRLTSLRSPESRA